MNVKSRKDGSKENVELKRNTEKRETARTNFKLRIYFYVKTAKEMAEERKEKLLQDTRICKNEEEEEEANRWWSCIHIMKTPEWKERGRG